MELDEFIADSIHTFESRSFRKASIQENRFPVDLLKTLRSLSSNQRRFSLIAYRDQTKAILGLKSGKTTANNQARPRLTPTSQRTH